MLFEKKLRKYFVEQGIVTTDKNKNHSVQRECVEERTGLIIAADLNYV